MLWYAIDEQGFHPERSGAGQGDGLFVGFHQCIALDGEIVVHAVDGALEIAGAALDEGGQFARAGDGLAVGAECLVFFVDVRLEGVAFHWAVDHLEDGAKIVPLEVVLGVDFLDDGVAGEAPEKRVVHRE